MKNKREILLTKNILLIGSLWVCIVLNPNCTQHEKFQWKALLEKWTHIDVCPPEDPDYRLQQAGNQRDAVSLIVYFQLRATESDNGIKMFE